MKGEGEILKVTTVEDDVCFYFNSRKLPYHGGKKQGSKSFDVVKYDAISLHKVIAYKCE